MLSSSGSPSYDSATGEFYLTNLTQNFSCIWREELKLNTVFKWSSFVLAGLSFALGQSAVAEDDDPEMEEVVVTGSYIARAVEE